MTSAHKTVTIQGEDGFEATFKIKKLPVLKQASVSKTLATTVLPVINGLKVGMVGASSASMQDFLKSALSFDVGASVEAVCKALGDMDEEKLEALLLGLLSTTYLVKRDTEERLDSSLFISYACNDDLSVVVKLAMEVIGYCLPFGAKVKSLYGLATKAMSSLSDQMEKASETATQSGQSESSETT
jgi:hypothetical protein